MTPTPIFDPPTRAWLLNWARTSIEAHLRGAALALADVRPAVVETPSGCFVSLHHRDGALRGCIGVFDASLPLWRNVRDMAIAAATRDPRFPPLGSAELVQCVLEISALSPLRPARAEEVEVGRHGLAVERGYARGVLLPQVATENGWDRETFLAHTCRKAGLPASAWREPAVRISVFEAEVFAEEA